MFSVWYKKITITALDKNQMSKNKNWCHLIFWFCPNSYRQNHFHSNKDCIGNYDFKGFWIFLLKFHNYKTYLIINITIYIGLDMLKKIFGQKQLENMPGNFCRKDKNIWDFILNTRWRYKYGWQPSMWRGRKRCQQYLGPRDHTISIKI